MDCESDGSERWEDFFGSSTDISLSVFAYYDRLSSSTDDTNSLNSLSHNKSTSLVNRSTSYDNHSLLGIDRSSPSPHINVTNVSDSRIVLQSAPPPPLPKYPPPLGHRRHRHLALSPNVQRLLSKSNSSLLPDDMNEHQTIDESNSDSVKKRSPSGQCFGPSVTNGSKFKHPLTKNTDKLTQFGDSIIDDSDGGYVTPPDENLYENHETHRDSLYENRENNLYEDINSNEHDYEDAEEAEEKTPINECSPFNFDQIDDQINGNADDDVYDSVEKDPNWNLNESKVDDDDGNEDGNDDESRTSLKNCSFVHSVLNKSETAIQNGLSQSDSAHNSPTLSQKSTDSATTNTTKTSTTSTPTKSQLFTIKDQMIEQSAKYSPVSNSSTDLNINETMVDNGEKTNDTIHEKPLKTQNNKDNGQITIDLKRTKIRPLSSVSISSTSSSSSCASDEHSSNQNAISYLASVESLADHSENELAILSSNLTVTERACLEIIDSERSYVNDLGQVIRGYLNDWQKQGHLESHDLNTLFGNIQEVYDFNVILLRELEQSGTEPIKIAECFIKLQDEFDAYTQYCTSYPDAISLLTTLLQASHTNALLATTQQSLHHTLPLGSYLLKPVQRILKYHLLLDNLRKHCDVQEVLQAHEIMRNVAQHIDKVKRDLEQQSRVRELSGILDGWLGPELTVLGDLVVEGILTENGKPRTVLLFETMLIITKKKEDNRLQFKTYINCKSLMLIEHLPGDPESFVVIPYNDPHPNQIKLTARNRDQKRKWAQHIKQVMLAHFNIPNRAKELLFKLGEEEDRTTDKGTWRWANHSSTTPEYLERRNQYRRSETRYRSKKQRKKFNSSLSMVEDQYDHGITNDNDNGKSKVLNSMIKELQKRNSMSKPNDDTESIASGTTQVTDVDSKEIDENDDYGNFYEIPFDPNKALPSKPASALDKAKSKLLEVKMYNTKTLPKRIANLKKQRSKTLKETSKFYMALPEENKDTETVLKITETNDDFAIGDLRLNRRRASLDATDTVTKTLNEDINRKLCSVSLLTPMNLNQKSAMNKNKRDIDIISELLKDHKEFDRILKKPPKKFSEVEKIPSKQTKFPKSESLFHLPLPPIPVEANEPNKMDASVQRELPPEPIYESLLRNVHVPYKFPSPVLNRSLSQPNNRFIKVKRPTEAPPKRPDSDYVTLTFDENGEMTGVDDDIRLPKHGSHFRKSDTNINYHVRKMPDEKVPSVESFESSGEIEHLRRSTSSETNNRLCASSVQSIKSSDLLSQPIQLPDTSTSGMDVCKSVDHLNINRGINKLPERRVSDVTGMHRKSIIHKQGSKALGSRIASIDYADPKLLFANSNTYLSLANKPHIKNVSNIQRDSAFSLTSSNDSVNIAIIDDTTIKSDDIATVQPMPVIYTNDFKPEPAVPSLNVCNVVSSHSSRGSSSNNSGDDSYYEKTVETYLENDGIFRDSAIYSDDNIEKPYTRPEHIYSTIDEVKQEEKIKPLIPPKLHLKINQNGSVVTRTAPPLPTSAPPQYPPPLPASAPPQYPPPQLPIFAIPPPVPAKPTFVAPILSAKTTRRSDQTLEHLLATPLPPSPTDEIDSDERNEKAKSMPSKFTDNTRPTESIIKTKQTNAEPEKNGPPQTAPPPPPVPARSFVNKHSSWVMKQIQNFDK